jgi:lipopolysaccharide/colanic/teichoic acid biosynthesis glycosyltransferase
MVAVFKDSAIQSLQPFILYNLAAVIGLAIAAIRGRSAAPTLLAGGFVDGHTLAFKQIVYVGVTMLVVSVAAINADTPPVLMLSFLGGFLTVLYVVFLVCHISLPKRLACELFSNEREQRTLLIGPVDKGRAIARWFEETAAFGFGMRGSVTDGNGEESRILHVTRVSDVATLECMIKDEGIKQIILLGLPTDKEALDLVVDTANKLGVCLDIVNDLPERLGRNVTFFNLHGLNLISLRNQPLENPLSRILKRTLDLLVALPVLIFILPPSCLLVKIFQAIQSPGPLFSRETRSGLGNRPFRSFSFRTLRVADGGSSGQTAVNDERMYAMGRFLRSAGLDEIPQFLNVFFGQMSVVGPRSRKAIHNRRFSSIMNEYNVRTLAKPGVTGLAQISGFHGDATGESDVEESAKLDIRYIENWSLPLDLWIICKAICQVIKPPKLAR